MRQLWKVLIKGMETVITRKVNKVVAIKEYNIIITGATGFIGTYAVQYFLKKNWTVYAIVRPGKEYLLKNMNQQS